MLFYVHVCFEIFLFFNIEGIREIGSDFAYTAKIAYVVYMLGHEGHHVCFNVARFLMSMIQPTYMCKLDRGIEAAYFVECVRCHRRNPGPLTTQVRHWACNLYWCL